MDGPDDADRQKGVAEDPARGYRSAVPTEADERIEKANGLLADVRRVLLERRLPAKAGVLPEATMRHTLIVGPPPESIVRVFLWVDCQAGLKVASDILEVAPHLWSNTEGPPLGLEYSSDGWRVAGGDAVEAVVRVVMQKLEWNPTTHKKR